MITIVDYAMGNLGSISNMLKKVGAVSEITCDPARIAGAEKLILPGVGAFDAGMRNLRDSGFVPALSRRVLEDRVPVLGICLGMQLMTDGSEEGTEPGLSWVPAHALRFKPSDPALKVPHMGWNRVQPNRPDPLLHELADDVRFYFVHSYYVSCADPSHVLLNANYGERFDAAFRCGNIWGVQFHPEKSHRFGMQLLRNFAERC